MGVCLCVHVHLYLLRAGVVKGEGGRGGLYVNKSNTVSVEVFIFLCQCKLNILK